MLHIYLYIGAERFVRAMHKLLNVWYPRHGGVFLYRLGGPYHKHIKSLGLGVSTGHNSIEFTFDNGKEVIAIVHVISWRDDAKPVDFYYS